MQTIGAFEAKTHFSSLLEKVQNGEHIVITKHGMPVAQLIPISKVNKSDLRRTIAAIKKFNSLHSLGELDWKTLRDEGRR